MRGDSALELTRMITLAEIVEGHPQLVHVHGPAIGRSME